jgi:hypothetical protein
MESETTNNAKKSKSVTQGKQGKDITQDKEAKAKAKAKAKARAKAKAEAKAKAKAEAEATAADKGTTMRTKVMAAAVGREGKDATSGTAAPSRRVIEDMEENVVEAGKGSVFSPMPPGSKGFYPPGEAPNPLPYRQSSPTEVAQAAMGKVLPWPAEQGLEDEALAAWRRMMRHCAYRVRDVSKYGEMLLTIAPLEQTFVRRPQRSAVLTDILGVSHKPDAIQPCFMLCRFNDTLCYMRGSTLVKTISGLNGEMTERIYDKYLALKDIYSHYTEDMNDDKDSEVSASP